MNNWLVNYKAAKAAGLIDFWPNPESLGVMQDPKTKAMRLSVGSPSHETRLRMGLTAGKPDDGHIWDIFNSVTDLERAERGLGIQQATMRERLAKVAQELEKRS